MKLVILDRDGTINQDSDEFIKSPEEWIPLPGALEAIAKLNHAGWQVVIASNQSGLGRGLFDVASLNAMHARMNKMLAGVGGRIEAVFYCPHTPEEDCSCRKPKPGLFTQIGERFGVELAKGLDLVGLGALEMFVTRDGKVLANEMAPRPHNSGHWTIDACATSQFEQLVRAVCGLPLGPVDVLAPSRMENLIGDEANDWPRYLADPTARLHLYGKAESRPGRKMGHVTYVLPS